MTPFEFVFALVSVITSLALTSIIGGVVGLARSSQQGRIGLVHGLWIYIAFMLVIANWAGLWVARLRTEWPPSLFAAQLATMITLYAFAALVIPAQDGAPKGHLTDFHQREGRRYMVAHLAFTLVAIALAFVHLGATFEALQSRIPALIGFVLGALALTVRAQRVQVAVAVVLALLVTVFAANNLHIAG